MIRAPLLAAAAAVALAACATASSPQPGVSAAAGSGPTTALGWLVGPADPAQADPPKTTLTGYLHHDDLDGDVILGPPPAAGSPRELADRAAYEETRGLEGSARWKQAQRDNDLWYGGAVKRFSCALGREIAPATTPVLATMLQRIELDVRTVGHPAKDRFFRSRPLIGNDKPICIPRADWLKTNASYPSGHSMTGWAWGLLLAELAPARATTLVEAGREMGDSRVICGAHFPSDVEAGRVLSSAMMARLHADPAFQRDLAVARTEIAALTRPAADCPAS